MPTIDDALALAVECAREFAGATRPNPPVGAVALDRDGMILAAGAHHRAGELHAEAVVLAELRARGLLSRAHTLVVTLEPCNHQGRTPPCTDAIRAAGIQKVVFAISDPNPKVKGGGAAALKAFGIEVIERPTEAALRLVAPFSKWVKTGLPWVVVKQALDSNGSMIPPPGTKTFTSKSSLKLAHELRRESDALITGSGTILADSPEFTVRHVREHENHRRFLVFLDRRGRVPEAWLEQARSRGLDPHRAETPQEALKWLGKQGALQVLVEGGPLVSQAFLDEHLWDRHVIIKARPDSSDDEVQDILR